MYSNNGINGKTPQSPCSANGPNAILYPNQLQFRIGIESKKSNAKRTYVSNIPNAIGAKIMEFFPALRSVNLFFVSLIRRSDADTVNT